MTPAPRHAGPVLPALLDTYAFEALLKKAARSFQLSLRILPKSIRPTLSLAYLLARASDTIADASTAPAFQRTALLRSLPDSFPETIPDLGLVGTDAELVQRLPSLLEALNSLPEADDIRAVWRIILEGQLFDVERFSTDLAAPPTPPLTPEELDRYIGLVAGSVGEFWARLCLRHIPDCSTLPAQDLLPVARRFGEALQLVNILRDRRRDADAGRVYIPDERFYIEMQRVREWLASGDTYAAAMRPRSLRAACLLPLDLARQTLDLIAAHPLGENIKVPRHKVWISFAKAFASPARSA